MRRVITVANRLPFSVTKRKGTYTFQPSPGGVASGLSSFYKNYEGVWIGWPGIPHERLKKDSEQITELLRLEGCYPVFLSRYDDENYYNGFCNKTIWPLFHYFTQYTVFNKRLWDSYKRVNENFCEAVVKVAREGDIIWIHDYHFMLLPQMIREQLPDVKIGYFLHIPFPSSEVFRLLPWRKEMLTGLLGADLLGFHTYYYAHHFLAAIQRILGINNAMSQVSYGNRVVRVDSFPMGIDYDRYAGAGALPEVKKEKARIRTIVKDKKVILSIDRLDYTKGLSTRLEAYEQFLENHPEYRGKVTLVMVTVPSRTKVEHYSMLKRQVDELTGRINGKYGTIDWQPIRYLYRSVPFKTLAALYHMADIALVTPMRDGMNLVAKEYIASKTDGKGVLILSELAGAAYELCESLIINPCNIDDTVRALSQAMSMDEEEQIRRNRAMQERLKRYDIARWADDFMNRLLHIEKIHKELTAKRLTKQTRKQVVADYAKARKRLILLDYDGTLVDFSQSPEGARPDKELLDLIRKLDAVGNNDVVVISGRDRMTLEEWLGPLDLNIIGEHGVWRRSKGGSWETIVDLTGEWKDKLRSILQLYTDRTPGSLIEEKDYSLVWHYRRAEPKLGILRAKEFMNAISPLAQDIGLSVLEGNKVVEIKNSGIDKGSAAAVWIEKGYDFILAAGDDRTDEDLFAVLPASAYTVKVRIQETSARLNVESVTIIRSLLEDFLKTT